MMSWSEPNSTNQVCASIFYQVICKTLYAMTLISVSWLMAVGGLGIYCGLQSWLAVVFCGCWSMVTFPTPTLKIVIFGNNYYIIYNSKKIRIVGDENDTVLIQPSLHWTSSMTILTNSSSLQGHW
jgi:hypothetical protein